LIYIVFLVFNKINGQQGENLGEAEKKFDEELKVVQW
jgi:hypothetical protein